MTGSCLRHAWITQTSGDFQGIHSVALVSKSARGRMCDQVSLLDMWFFMRPTDEMRLLTKHLMQLIWRCRVPVSASALLGGRKNVSMLTPVGGGGPPAKPVAGSLMSGGARRLQHWHANRPSALEHGASRCRHGLWAYSITTHHTTHTHTRYTSHTLSHPWRGDANGTVLQCEWHITPNQRS